jgi:hypothetical protein
VGETVSDTSLVNTTLNGFSKSWEPFVKGICAREKLSSFEKLWVDFIRGETREVSKASRQGGREENLTLVSQTRKGKGKCSKKKGNSEEAISQLRMKMDLSKVKCFACQKLS